MSSSATIQRIPASPRTPLIQREGNEPIITPATLKTKVFAERFWATLLCIGCAVLTGLVLSSVVGIGFAVPTIIGCLLAINMLNNAKALEAAAEALKQR